MVTLAAVVALLGPALSAIPLDGLRLFVGGLLLVFGCNGYARPSCAPVGTRRCTTKRWCSSRRSAAARRAGVQRRGLVLDWYAFTLSYKGVLLEGLEVAFIALTFGAISTTFRWPLLPRSPLYWWCRCRHGGAGAAVSSAREQHEVRRRSHADRVSECSGVPREQVRTGRLDDAALLILVPAVALYALALVALFRRRSATASPLNADVATTERATHP